MSFMQKDVCVVVRMLGFAASIGIMIHQLDLQHSPSRLLFERSIIRLFSAVLPHLDQIVGISPVKRLCCRNMRPILVQSVKSGSTPETMLLLRERATTC
jgi:hypothetical protein